jgi:hypothetical protein
VKQVSPLVFLLTALGMALVGVICAILGALIGAHAVGSADFMALGAAIIGMLFGYALGNVIGLVVVKYPFRQNGSVLLGVLGAVIWTGLSVGVAALLNLSNDASSWVVSAMFLLTPLAALFGFYLTRSEAS